MRIWRGECEFKFNQECERVKKFGGSHSRFINGFAQAGRAGANCAVNVGKLKVKSKSRKMIILALYNVGRLYSTDCYITDLRLAYCTLAFVQYRFISLSTVCCPRISNTITDCTQNFDLALNHTACVHWRSTYIRPIFGHNSFCNFAAQEVTFAKYSQMEVRLEAITQITS